AIISLAGLKRLDLFANPLNRKIMDLLENNEDLRQELMPRLEKFSYLDRNNYLDVEDPGRNWCNETLSALGPNCTHLRVEDADLVNIYDELDLVMPPENMRNLTHLQLHHVIGGDIDEICNKLPSLKFLNIGFVYSDMVSSVILV